MTTSGKDDYTLLVKEMTELKEYFNKNGKKYDTISENQLHKEFDTYFKEKNKPDNLKNLFKNIYKKNLPKEISILIMGKSGQGKSTLFNNLFDTDFTTKRSGRGTDFGKDALNKEVEFGGLKIKVTDTVGLGDSQSGKKETDFASNNNLLRDYLTKEGISCIFQVFDFNRNRDLTEEKIQIENILKNIDFQCKDKKYIDIIKRISIIFVRTNQYTSNDSFDDNESEQETIKDKTDKIERIVRKFRDSENEHEKKEKLMKLTKFTNELNQEFDQRFKENTESIKTFIKEYLIEIKDQDKNISINIDEIISNFIFTYSGNINKKTKKINPIPNFSNDFYDDFNQYIKKFDKEYKFDAWNENWRYQIFEALMVSCGNKQAVAIKNAIKKEVDLKLQKKSDNGVPKVSNKKVEDFYKPTKTTKKIINDGKKEIWKDICVGIGSGGSVGGAAYYAGAIAGGPATAIAGVVGIIGIGLYNYFWK